MVTITKDLHHHHWVHMLVGKAESSNLNMMTTDTVIPGMINMLIMEMNLNITIVSIMIEDSLAAEITSEVILLMTVKITLSAIYHQLQSLKKNFTIHLFVL